MYRHWIAFLLLSVLITTGCVLLVANVCDSSACRLVSVLPFQLIVTAYYVSMLIVRRYFDRRDEVRYRAHFLRGTFLILTLVSWLFPLTAFLVSKL